ARGPVLTKQLTNSFTPPAAMAVLPGVPLISIQRSPPLPPPHSFPTRRSSDLTNPIALEAPLRCATWKRVDPDRITRALAAERNRSEENTSEVRSPSAMVGRLRL